MEFLESENDSLKSEIFSLSSKIEASQDINFKRSDGAGSYQKQAKVRKVQPAVNETISSQMLQIENIPQQPPIDPIKSLAASLISNDFKSKPINEQSRIISRFDEDSALETVSWAILNSGRIPQIQQEVDFLIRQ